MIGKNRDKELKQNDSIIHIEHTTDRIQLAQWYSEADVFVNPTMGDNFPTVNIEALACGTPVVTFDTGGSGESVGECGMVIPQENIDRMSEAIRKILLQRIDPKVCVERAQLYDKNTRYKDYIYRFADRCKSVR
jgi:glycosyltransferase involved in cell wall biosynthesis